MFLAYGVCCLFAPAKHLAAFLDFSFTRCGFCRTIPALIDRGMRLGFSKKLRMHLQKLRKKEK